MQNNEKPHAIVPPVVKENTAKELSRLAMEIGLRPFLYASGGIGIMLGGEWVMAFYRIAQPHVSG